jgi:hypothetical protein
MKTQMLCLTILASFVCAVHSQTIFLYDQESVSSDYDTGESGYSVMTNQPLGQAFTPSLSSVGFVRLQLVDPNRYYGTGATIYVNLWAGSIEGNGDLLGSTAPIFLPLAFGLNGTSPITAETNFVFAAPISVTPGQSYYLQPVVQSGDDIVVLGNYFSYAGGSLLVNGAVKPNQSLWFREGILVPEPSPLWLVLLGSGVWFYVRRIHRNSGLV